MEKKRRRKKSRLIEKREKVGVSRYEKRQKERKRERERNWVSGVGWGGLKIDMYRYRSGEVRY